VNEPRRKRQYVVLPPSSPSESGVPRAKPRSLEAIALALFARPRRDLIAEAAYYRALRRGFGAGGAMEDWLAAEAEVDARLRRSRPARSSMAQPGVAMARRPERSHR